MEREKICKLASMPSSCSVGIAWKHSGNSAIKECRYTTYKGYLGGADDTQLTRDVCELIRKNADIVEGIFCGHTHENAYTEK